MEQDIRGAIIPVVTPFENGNEKIDESSLRRLISFMIESGAHGIWAAGTTGEFAALNEEEHQRTIEIIVDEVAGRVKVIANISRAATASTIELAKRISQIPVDGVAATPPYYYLHDQNEIIDHFHMIRAAVDFPLWVYDIPGTVKLNVSSSTIASLSRDGTVVGVKDSSGIGESFAELVGLCNRDKLNLLRFVGSSHRICFAPGIGAHGVVPGIANVCPATVVKVWEAADRGDYELAYELQLKVAASTKIGKVARSGAVHASMFAGYKAALKILGIIDNDSVAAPLRNLLPEEKKEIENILKQLQLIT